MSGRLSSMKSVTLRDVEEDIISEPERYFEDSGNWRKIIFLPCNMLWRVMIVLSILLDCWVVTYNISFSNKLTAADVVVYYLCECFYFVDVVLTIMHRYMLPYRKTQVYLPKNSYILLIDVITLLPYYEVYYILHLSSRGRAYGFSWDYMKSKVFLRISNIALFFYNTNNIPGLNHVLITTVLQIVTFYLYQVIISSFFFALRKVNGRKWTDNLVYHSFDNESSIQWYILTNTIIGNVLAHNWSGIVKPENLIEELVFMVTMVLGFLMHIMIFFGQLTALYIKKMADQYNFSARLNVIAQMLDDWNVSNKIKREAIDKYNQFWEKKYGTKRMPQDFYEIPKSLRSDCTIDVFWHALKHSQLFNELDFPTLKNLSLRMRNEFYMPGEFLYRCDEIKDKMYYIVSGVVEVIGDNKQGSSIISFSGGTVLGEISSLMLLKSMVCLRCATYTTVQTLDAKNLARTMKKYYGTNKKLRNKLSQRLQLAREMQHEDLVKLKIKSQKRTSVKWIKQQWCSIYVEHKAKTALEERYQQITVYHTSRLLGLYVLSDDVELKKKIICLKSTCPYLLEPSSSFRRFCEYIVLGAVVIQSLLLPYLCFFQKKFTDFQTGWLYMLDLVFFFGLYLDLSTVIKNNRKKHMTRLSNIIMYRGKQVSTLVDIFSMLPLEFTSLVLSMSTHTIAVLRLNRVIRIYKIFRAIQQAQLNVWVNYLQIRLIKYFLLFLYTLYVISCIMFGMSCFSKCDPYGWLSYNSVLMALVSDTGKNKSERATNFLLSLDYTASRLLSLTWAHNYAYSMMDIIMEHLITLLGYYLFSFCFAELAACSVLQLEVRNKYLRYLKGLKFFAARTRIPSNLKNFMYDMVRCHWHYNKRYDVTGPRSIVIDMPENLKNDILIEGIVRCLKTVPFFIEVEDDFIRSVAKSAELNVLPPGTIILREDVLQTQMHVILRGYCTVESSIPTDKYHKYINTYSYGDCFPLMELFLGVNTFLKVVSATTVELITLHRRDLMNCIKSRDRLYQDLKKVQQVHMDAYYMVLTRQKGRLPEMLAGQKSLGRGDYFAYEVNDKIREDAQKVIFVKTYQKLGIWDFLKYFLFRRTLEPTSKIFVTWEIFRCTIATLYALYVLFFMKFYMKKREPTDAIIRRSFDAILIFDLYVRLHVQYYDGKGIKVTHPLYTAYHYLKTSFALDAFCVFPFQDLNLHTMFGSKHRYHVLMLLYNVVKPLNLHRAFNGLNYLQEESKQGRAMLYQNIRYVGLVLVVLGILSSTLEIITCWEKSNTRDIFYTCSNETWITKSMFKSKIERSLYTPSITCIYAVLSIFATCTVGVFKFDTSKELIFNFSLTAILFGLRWFVLAKITSSRISGNRTLVHYQHNMKVFLDFMKKYCPDSNLAQEAASHYEHVWKKTKGYTTGTTLSSFHKVLKSDLTVYLYSAALKASYLLWGVDANTIRFISSYFEEIYYRKDAEIIRCNDINEYIYIVYKGQVEISVANDKLCTLPVGGMFGCLSANGNTRQTINAKAKVNVDILKIENTVFNNLITGDSKIKQKLTRERFLKTEYLMPYDLKRTSKTDLTSDGTSGSLHFESRTLKTFFINPSNTYYMIYSYITNVHLATLSSLFIMTIIVAVEHSHMHKYNVYIYLMDTYFLIKIVMGFHVTYMDQESGLFVKCYSMIWRRYIKSLTGFWLDLGSLLPFELIASFFFEKNSSLLNYFLLNRTLRVLFMIKYYTDCKNTLTVSKHLRWTYLMYVLILLIHLNACLWWLIACPKMTCSYFKRISHEPLITVDETDTMSSFRLAYLYVINVFSSTGLKIITPTTNAELIATIVMVCVAQYILIALTAGFASMLVQDKSVMTNFERKASHVLKYLELANLSLSLRNRVWNYYIMLWTRARGPWMPKLITDAPSYIKEDIMEHLFGKYLRDHFLFKRTHIDFQRQLIICMDVCVFLPGMYIVQKGDVDNCMYFIDKGEVIVYEKYGKTEVEHVVLNTGKSFGEGQGLFCIPHDKSYKARYTSRILILNKKKWKFLLEWFPASREQIEEQANRRLGKHKMGYRC